MNWVPQGKFFYEVLFMQVLSRIKMPLCWFQNALKCAYVKLGIGRTRMKMYWAPQAKIFLGSAFHTSFVEDKDGN